MDSLSAFERWLKLGLTRNQANAALQASADLADALGITQDQAQAVVTSVLRELYLERFKARVRTAAGA